MPYKKVISIIFSLSMVYASSASALAQGFALAVPGVKEIDLSTVKEKDEKKGVAKIIISSLGMFENLVFGENAGYLDDHIKFVFDRHDEVSTFVKQQGESINNSHYQFISVTTKLELINFLGLTGLSRNIDIVSMQECIESEFKKARRIKAYAVKFVENEYEYVWICFSDEKYYSPLITNSEYFYVNKKRMAHGFSNISTVLNPIAMGIDRVHPDLEQKGHMKVLFRIKQSILQDIFNPIGFIVLPEQFIGSWARFFFYIKRGYLPINPEARKKIIDNYYKQWFRDKNYRIAKPKEVFGMPLHKFVESFRRLILFLRDPRLELSPDVDYITDFNKIAVNSENEKLVNDLMRTLKSQQFINNSK